MNKFSRFFSSSCRIVELLPRCPPLTGNEMVRTLSSIREKVANSDSCLVLQHDRAPWYSAKVTQLFVQGAFPHVLPVTLWPVPSRFYNPLDYWLFPFVQRKIIRNHKLQNNSDLFDFVADTICRIPADKVKLNNAKLLDKLSAKITAGFRDKRTVDWFVKRSRKMSNVLSAPCKVSGEEPKPIVD